MTEFVPAVVCAAAMPLAYSIAQGIAFGFITYAGVKLLAGRVRDIPSGSGDPGGPVRAEIRSDLTAWGACDSA
ncbi:hypothetical protein KXR53_25115 [Inquilinus limosus]|uniref:hypothetical protein n=1 Tax=Inquilinus limosus TaxID=171674 RepID=UPI003F168B52